MGYEVHIIRSDDWIDTEGKQITGEEWRGVVEADPEMRIFGAEQPDCPLAAEWLGHPDIPTVWFDFRDGQVVIKSPDERIINEAIEIARRLGARVQGDDGEFYDEPLEVKTSRVEKGKAWLRRLLK